MRLATLLLLLVPGCSLLDQPQLHLSPKPQHVELREGQLRLGADYSVRGQTIALLGHAGHVADGLLNAAGRRRSSFENGAFIDLKIDEDMAEHSHHIQISPKNAIVRGHSLQDVAHGTATLVQLVQVDEQGPWLPCLDIEDRAPLPYRAVMLDCARSYHSPETLRQVIRLCWLCKVPYLHLHLTDDPAFTFPSKHLPQLSAKSRFRYSRDELARLVDTANEHGVVLVPEIDLPGHSRAAIRALPELFGLKGKNRRVINMGREAVYEALEKLLAEVADVFSTSPYIHIGGDEVSFAGIAEDPDCAAYMKAHDLDGPRELYRHFLTRMHAIVRKLGRQTICWEGFAKAGKVKIPEDMIVVAWETTYQTPADLLANGHRIINGSWKPLYVVGGGRKEPKPKMWPPEQIYAWHPLFWDNPEAKAPSFGGMDLGKLAKHAHSKQVLGAQMCVWEQKQDSVVPSLLDRLPAFSERCWNPDSNEPWADVERRCDALRALAQRLLR